jgi:hypothetical protein
MQVFPAAGFFPVGQRVVRSLPERRPAFSLAGPRLLIGYRLKAINSRTGKGQPGRCPFQSGAEMNAKITRGLVLLAALALLCATIAWAVDHAVFGSVFAALGVVAVLGAAGPRPRS